jgi:hypothetical protein
MSQAYRNGWDRVFAPKPPPRMITNPFPLRSGMRIPITTPSDMKLKDLPRLIYYLHTMCDDWRPEDGFPNLTLPGRRGP